MTSAAKPGKSPAAFRTISEVATELDVPQHVLRFWESKFSQVKPVKRGGGRRYYRPEDIDLLRTIQILLYDNRYTIKGVQKLFRDQGAKAIVTSVMAGNGGVPFSGPAGVDGGDSDTAHGSSRMMPGYLAHADTARAVLADALVELEALKSLLDGPGATKG